MRAETLHRNAAYRDPTHPQGDAPCAVCVTEAAAYPPAPVVRTEVHDGLEFAVPTWDPTPTPWNPSGSWADDPDLDARLCAAILAAVPDFPRLAAEANQATGDNTCQTYWGSHGCGLTAGHDGLCVCTPGSESPDPEDQLPCSVGLKYGEGDTMILAWNGETQPSVLHWRWYR